MDYHYEALDHQGFQKLCQALLLSVRPDTQCLPVEQPDGGRDAYAINVGSDQTEFVVFQIKFSLAPDTKSERDTIQEVIRSEQTKVEDLINRGATHYYLLTNVRGTAHPNTGSVDKAGKPYSSRRLVFRHKFGGVTIWTAAWTVPQISSGAIPRS